MVMVGGNWPMADRTVSSEARASVIDTRKQEPRDTTRTIREVCHSRRATTGHSSRGSPVHKARGVPRSASVGHVERQRLTERLSSGWLDWFRLFRTKWNKLVRA